MGDDVGETTEEYGRRLWPVRSNFCPNMKTARVSFSSTVTDEKVAQNGSRTMRTDDFSPFLSQSSCITSNATNLRKSHESMCKSDPTSSFRLQSFLQSCAPLLVLCVHRFSIRFTFVLLMILIQNNNAASAVISSAPDFVRCPHNCTTSRVYEPPGRLPGKLWALSTTYCLDNCSAIKLFYRHAMPAGTSWIY